MFPPASPSSLSHHHSSFVSRSAFNFPDLSIAAVNISHHPDPKEFVLNTSNSIVKEEHGRDFTAAWISTLVGDPHCVNNGFSVHNNPPTMFNAGTETMMNMDEYGYAQLSAPPVFADATSLPLPSSWEEAVQSTTDAALNSNSLACDPVFLPPLPLMGAVGLERLMKDAQPLGDVGKSNGYEEKKRRDLRNPEGVTIANQKKPKLQGITMEHLILAKEWIEGITVTTVDCDSKPSHACLSKSGDGRVDNKDRENEQEVLMLPRQGEKRPLRAVGMSVDAQSVAARQRRMKISQNTWKLAQLIPCSAKMDTTSMLDSAMNYVRFLEAQQVCFQNERNIIDANLNERVLLNHLALCPQIQHQLSQSGLCLVTTRQASMLNFDPRSLTEPSTTVTKLKPRF